MRHSASALWLQRHLPFLIPPAILDNDFVGVTFPDDYQWHPYPGEIVLFRASEAPRLPDESDSLGWQKIAFRGAKVEFVPGDHESMFQEPHLQVFGQKLRAAMEQGEVAAAVRIPCVAIS